VVTTYDAIDIGGPLASQGFALEGNWNNFGMVCMAGEFNGKFQTQIGLYTNGYPDAEVTFIEFDYMEDYESYTHMIGRNVDGAGFKGFIADISYMNYAVASFEDLTVRGTAICGPAVCTACPAGATFIDCIG
jgi:hypothetical protein